MAFLGRQIFGIAVSEQVSSLKVVGVVSLGGFLELYDFIIYAMMAGYIADHFFPSSDGFVSLLLVFSTFSVGYLARPLGGIVFGHIGDRYGRKSTFSWSVLLMACSTLGIALLPGYSVLGVAAPFVLTVLRLIQGFSLGGELPGAITYLRETQPRPGLAGGALFLALMLGVAGASFVHFLLIGWLGQEEVSRWGWRLAFAAGGSLGFISFYIRRRFQESPVFLHMLKHRQQTRVPFLELIRNHGRNLLGGVLVIGMSGAVVTVLVIFGPSYYARVMGYPASDISFAMAVSSVVVSPFCLVGGLLCDRLSGRQLPLLAGGVLCLFSLPAFFLWQGGVSVWAITLPASIIAAFMTGGISVYLGTLFPPQIRYSGVGMTYNFGMTLFGGLAPPLIMLLVDKTGNLAVPGYYLTVVGICGLLGALLLKGKPVSALPEEGHSAA